MTSDSGRKQAKELPPCRTVYQRAGKPSLTVKPTDNEVDDPFKAETSALYYACALHSMAGANMAGTLEAFSSYRKMQRPKQENSDRDDSEPQQGGAIEEEGRGR